MHIDRTIKTCFPKDVWEFLGSLYKVSVKVLWIGQGRSQGKGGQGGQSHPQSHLRKNIKQKQIYSVYDMLVDRAWWRRVRREKQRRSDWQID